MNLRQYGFKWDLKKLGMMNEMKGMTGPKTLQITTPQICGKLILNQVAQRMLHQKCRSVLHTTILFENSLSAQKF